ncbi:ATP-binding cassette domain-containing protein, partial [candidate division WWE3 bacterium]|nr:ATP-binding cassette domain-containing protein [candidate division WWE3 bacterium]
MISVQNFSKSFGKQSVISDLSFDVNKGEIFAFLGANGSGKTTTIRTLLGIYQPTAGNLLIKGEPFNHSMSAYIGYL